MIRKTFACALLTGILAAAANAQGPQTVDELIARNIEARGGLEKIKAVKSLRMTGKMVPGPDVEAAFTTELARPNKVRTEVTFRGQSRIQVFNGQSAWLALGNGEPQAVPAEEVKSVEQQADFDGPLVDFQAKGNRIELAGKEDVAGKPAYNLKVTKKNGDVETHSLDAETFLEVKVAGKSTVRGEPVEGETTLGDYRKVDGLTYPFSVHSKQKGAPGGMAITFSKIEVNPDLPASRFEKPQP
jgi:outer membrane lipoprotein-sorting protein